MKEYNLNMYDLPNKMYCVSRKVTYLHKMNINFVKSCTIGFEILTNTFLKNIPTSILQNFLIIKHHISTKGKLSSTSSI